MLFKNKSGSQTRSRRRFSKKWLALSLVVLAIGVVVVLELTNTTHFFHTPPSKVIVQAGKRTAPAKNNSSASKPPAQKSATPNSDRNIGTATDTNGSSTASTSPSQWIVSRSGAITVKQPIANATLKSGDILSGSAKIDRVNFRLIDNKVGVIAEGMLNVVNGHFSGNLNFTPHASTGRLDVFSTDSKGVELNEVQIAVSY